MTTPSRFLERWSRLKRRGDAGTQASPAVAPASIPPPQVDAMPSAEAVAAVPAADAALPPLESLSLEADFSGFLKKEVSESLRRAALRKLFSDPHFHFDRMDRLDIYIDDYSVSDPIPPDMMKRLRQFDTLLKDDEEGAAVAEEAARTAPVDAPQGAADAVAGDAVPETALPIAAAAGDNSDVIAEPSPGSPDVGT
ncbi:DUF3306 domain-containing protein [Aromatoleum diolicum]|uniref:DUF3306 domain-containing protein n=1 Tax=Aromatoleum diolicum TaxID=75796 RepID=A0ABX1Q8D9_9RHOO|nr:DUF3306 domain-containing protein [Aromatoleum diolicum]NMG74619.1 DUF3306 domain-containing protein [Aromatoleum diolicum]